MFYNKRLMNSKSFGKVWQVGNDINNDTDEEVSIPNVCRKLDPLVDSEHHNPRERLALKTSAVLINGTARYYKRKLHQLCEDIATLEKDIALAKRSRLDNACLVSADVSNIITSDKALFSKATSSELNTSGYPFESESSGVLRASSKSSLQMFPRLIETLPCPEELDSKINDLENGYAKKICEEDDFDETLPFGIVYVYDNYHSKKPNRVILSALDPGVRNLL